MVCVWPMKVDCTKRPTCWCFVCMAGENGRCQDKYPQVLYADSGRSEFYRIRLHLPQLIVDLNDPTFAVSFSVPIR